MRAKFVLFHLQPISARTHDTAEHIEIIYLILTIHSERLSFLLILSIHFFFLSECDTIQTVVAITSQPKKCWPTDTYHWAHCVL